MAGPLTILVFVGVGEAGDPATRSMERVTRTALGPDARVEVREARGEPTDGEALGAERGSHADAVVELSWGDLAHRQATIRVHVAQSGRWIERTVNFRSSDAAAERGRTLGFAVASMFPEGAAGEPSPAGAATSPSASPASPPAQSAAPPPSNPSPTSSASPPPPSPPAAPPASASAPAAAAPAPPSAPPPSGSAPMSASSSRVETIGSNGSPRGLLATVEFLGVAATGLTGSADSVGGLVAGSWFASPWLSLRLGAGARAGALDTAQASTLTMLAEAGFAFHPLRPTPSRRLGLSVRADYLGVRLTVTHSSSDDPTPVTQERLMSGVDGYIDASWLLTQSAEIVLGGGVEEVFGLTDIVVRGTPEATVPDLRAAGEGGIRIRFF